MAWDTRSETWHGILKNGPENASLRDSEANSPQEFQAFISHHRHYANHRKWDSASAS